MTRETEMETACPEQQSSVVTAGKKKAVTFDDWLRRDDGKYAVLQDVLLTDDECE